jgi:thioredoxin-like negative regulator of GroEL
LEKAIRSKDRLTVLFYASWCPFSQRFLPDFLEHAEASDQCFMRVVVDDKDDLVRKYAIEVYPTVLFFHNGKVTKRLDGVFHVGLNKSQLEEFVKQCRA